MKEFIEKLNGRLEECEKAPKVESPYNNGWITACQVMKNAVNELAEEHKDKDCSKCSRRSWYQIGYADAEKKFVEEHKGGWITDRTPTKEECGKFGRAFFQVTVPHQYNGDITSVMMYEYTTISGKEVARWYYWYGKVSPVEPIAWKPLDEPYKGE